MSPEPGFLAWPISVLLAGMLVSLGVGFVRGFAGFGYSAICVAGLSLFVSPAAIVPAVLTLEVVASIGMLRNSLPLIDRPWLGWLLAGNLVFVPLGVLLLAVTPANPLRLMLGLALLTSVLALKRNSHHVLQPSAPVKLVTAAASGLLNGVAASGGVVVAMTLAACRMDAQSLRATMVVFLLASTAYAMLCASLLTAGGTAALVGWGTLQWVLLLLPTMLTGMWLGRRSFARANPGNFRGHVLTLLTVIASLTMLRGGLGLLSG